MVDLKNHDFIISECGPMFADAVAISNNEAQHFLQTKQSENQMMGGATSVNQIGEEMQRKTEQYVTKFNVSDKEKMKFIRNEFQKLSDMPEIEYILLWNLVPSSYEEAITLIPSLRERPEEVINYILEVLNKNKIT